MIFIAIIDELTCECNGHENQGTVRKLLSVYTMCTVLCTFMFRNLTYRSTVLLLSKKVNLINHEYR
jgi:hypothetical protein